MTYVLIEEGNVVGVFHSAQAEPAPPGYAEIPDDDPRIAAFLAAFEAINKLPQ